MKKKTIRVLLALVLVTAVLACIHSFSRPKTEEGTLLIEYNGTSSVIALDELSTVPVKGTLVNGRGEEILVSGEGILLSEVLAAAEIVDYRIVVMIAEDEYSAEVTAEEVALPDKVYLMEQEEGGTRLVVFGDANSKRNVNGLVRLRVE